MWIVLALGCIALIIAGFCIRNMQYDAFDAARLRRAGMQQKEALLPDGTVIAYGEGPKNGPPLLLIHGQMVMWKDYARVLPAITRAFHVFAVDCHGHGESSKQRNKYSAVAMGQDFAWFIEHVVGESAFVSGHSSGGLLCAWLAANASAWVRGILVEDAPFFATEPQRKEKTFAWMDGFSVIHAFLAQHEELDYTRFYLAHSYLSTFFGKDWVGIQRQLLRYMDKHPGKPPRLFFMPPSMNRAFALTSGPYDIWFGETFYDGTWFDGFDQAETLARVACPAVLIHTKWSYDPHGILLSAMNGEDAARAAALMHAKLIHIPCGHNVHMEKPRAFVQALRETARACTIKTSETIKEGNTSP